MATRINLPIPPYGVAPWHDYATSVTGTSGDFMG